jgi:hypothetical protein
MFAGSHHVLVDAKVPIIFVIEIAAPSMGFCFKFGDLLMEKGTGIFDVVNIVGVTKTTFATEILCRAATVGVEGFSFLVGNNRGHGEKKATKKE